MKIGVGKTYGALGGSSVGVGDTAAVDCASGAAEASGARGRFSITAASAR